MTSGATSVMGETATRVTQSENSATPIMDVSMTTTERPNRCRRRAVWRAAGSTAEAGGCSVIVVMSRYSPRGERCAVELRLPSGRYFRTGRRGRRLGLRAAAELQDPVVDRPHAQGRRVPEVVVADLPRAVRALAGQPIVPAADVAGVERTHHGILGPVGVTRV